MTKFLVRSVCVVFSLMFCLGSSRSLWAAAPANDTCAGAEVIPALGPFPYLTSIRDITFATTNGDPFPLCSDPASLTRSLWYSFTPTVSGPYLISTCPSALNATTVDDTVMSIFTSTGGCAGPFVPLANACADDSCGLRAALTQTLQAGVKYFIVVWRYESGPLSPDSASLQLLVDQAIPPSNDTCANPVPLAMNVPTRGTTVSANDDYHLSAACFTGTGQRVSAAGGRDVVYSFTPPTAANYSFRLSNFDTQNSDPLLYVVSACPSGPRPVTVNSCLAIANRTVFGSSEEIFCLPLAAGQTVLLFVDDDATNAPGSTFFIEANVCVRETEPNDTTLSADPLVFGMEAGLNPETDVDIFTLGIPSVGSRLFALADGAALATSDLEMRVITASGTIEFDSGNNDQAFGNLSPNVAGTLLTNVPTYLRLERPVSGKTEPYRLYSVIQPPLSEATRETEPNNQLFEANFAANNYFYGTLSGPSPSTDVDSYGFDANAGDLLLISVDGDPLRNNTPIDAALQLLDESNNLLVSVDDAAATSLNLSNTSTNSGLYPIAPGEALVHRVEASGTYFVRVMIGSRATGAAAAGDYLLSICKNGVPGSDGRPADPFIESTLLLPNGHVQIFVQGTPGVTYRLVGSTDLVQWSPVPKGGGVPGSDGLFIFEDSAPTDSQHFYRVIWP